MSMSAGGGEGGIKSEINMTPLIDVLLVLLIIFMVITPLTPKGLETLVPQPPPPGTPPSKADDRTVVVIIEKDKSMKINSEVTTEEQLGPRLEEIFKTRAERIIFVKGDPDVEYQYVARAIDIAKGVGIDKVGLMTAKMEEGN
ncbi:MAG: biopolymer transporter ExbD [Acidobacteriota bacterium]